MVRTGTRATRAGIRWGARVVRGGGRAAREAASAGITSPDLAHRVPPGTLPPVTADRQRTGRRIRPPGPLPLVLVLVGVLIATLGFQHVTGVAILPALTAPDQPPPRRFPVLDPSQPVGIRIRAIRVRAAVHSVGLAEDGSIAVPPPDRYHEAGWYDQSPTPGQYGPAVLVGHVDTRTGPAVFHRLAEVRPGQRVEIDRADGSVAVFEVNSVQRYDKSRQPVERIYDDFSRPGLRLMTCGGRWVGGTTGYADNIVVFAALVDDRPPPR